jgi:hypothetical protein
LWQITAWQQYDNEKMPNQGAKAMRVHKVYEQSPEYRLGWADGFYGCLSERSALGRFMERNDARAIRAFALGYLDGVIVRLLGQNINWDYLKKLIDKNDWQGDANAITCRQLIRVRLLLSACGFSPYRLNPKMALKFRRMCAALAESPDDCQASAMMGVFARDNAIGMQRAD